MNTNKINQIRSRGRSKALVTYANSYKKALKRMEAITLEMANRMKDNVNWGDVTEMAEVNEYLHQTAVALGIETEDDN